MLGIDRLDVEEECSTSTTASASHSSQQITELEHKIHALQQRVDELQRQEESCTSGMLDTQMSQLLQADFSANHGPNTVNHFEEFSIDVVLAELRRNAPDVYKLFSI